MSFKEVLNINKKIIIASLSFMLILSACGKPASWGDDTPLGEILFESTEQTQETTIQSQESATTTPQPESTSESQEETTLAPISEIDAGFHYYQLTAPQQKAYAQIVTACKEFESDIPLDKIDLESVYAVHYAVAYDHPEFFWMQNFTVRTLDGEPVGIVYDIPSNAEEISQAIDEKTDQIIAQAPSDTYGKVKYFYEWIINNTDYQDAENDQDITSVFITNKSVCAGYSRAFLYLCNKSGIEAAYVSGFTDENVPHAWNVVKVGDYYYWVDTTWGDPIFAQENTSILNYNFLCVSDEELFRNHVINHKVTTTSYTSEDLFDYPKCPDDSLNYYLQTGSYFYEYDYNQLYNYVKDKFENDIYTNISVKYKTSEAYATALDEFFLLESPVVFEIFQEIHPEYSGMIYYDYSIIEEANYFEFSVRTE